MVPFFVCGNLALDQPADQSAALDLAHHILMSCNRYDLDTTQWTPESGFRSVFVVNCPESSVSNENQPRQSSPFQLAWTCTADATTCTKARDAFVRAGQRLQVALKITTPIVVKGTFRSFCQGQSTCALRNTLGQASAASFLLGPDGYMYPQALYKHISSAPTQYAAQDIIAEFNSDFNFYFGDGKIQPSQVDFELVLLHELVHGLGLTTSWNTWFKDAYPVDTSQDYLTPSFTVRMAPGTSSQNIQNINFGNWQPLQAFDRAMATQAGKSLIENYNRVTAFSGSGAALPGFLTGFKVSGDPYNAAKEVYSYATAGPRNLVYNVPNEAQFASGETIYLQTYANQYLQGSSIAHFDLQSYVNTPDFLMIPDVTNLTGQSLDEILARLSKDWAYGVMGPRLLGVLGSMGWPLQASPTSPLPTVNPTASPTVSPTQSAVPTMVVPSEAATVAGMPVPVFVGIVAGCLLGAGLLIGFIVWITKRTKRKQQAAGLYLTETLPFETASPAGYQVRLAPEMGYTQPVLPPVATVRRPPPPPPTGSSYYATPSTVSSMGRNNFSDAQIEADAALARMLQEQEDAIARGQTPRPTPLPSQYSSQTYTTPYNQSYMPSQTYSRSQMYPQDIASPLPPPRAGPSTQSNRTYQM
jgi:hypothetical protein